MEEKVRKITFWKIIKWIMLSISVFVYIISFWRIFLSCDASISDDLYLSKDEKADFDNLDIDYPLYNYQPLAWTNDDGTIQIKNIYYVEPLSEMQLTVRYRVSKYDTAENENPFYFNIRIVDSDDSETIIDDLEIHSATRYNHKYIRLIADDVVVDNGEKVTSPVQRVDEEGNVTYETTTETIGGNKVYLDIFDSTTNELQYSFVIAGKTLEGVRVRRSKVDVKVTD